MMYGRNNIKLTDIYNYTQKILNVNNASRQS
jgi:hypothetical protein